MMKGKRIYGLVMSIAIITGSLFGTNPITSAAANEVVAKKSTVDVNRDGKLSIADAVALSRLISEDRDVKADVVDVNNDGHIDGLDVIYLVKVLSKIDVTPIVEIDIPIEYFEETTTKATTTTTAKATTTVTKATTTTTAKATTTATKATTTTTAKATTPTTKATTTTTTKATTLTTKATTTTTTKATTLTTKATTTTTTKATTPTTKATTTTTTKATTPTTKATTTTTTKATTTTTRATTTTTTTTTVNKQAKQAAGYAAIKKAIDHISITDTVVPKYNIDSEHVEHKNIYLFKVDNKTYAYRIISDTTFSSEEELIKYTWDTAGIHFWEYTGKQTAVSRQDETPNTDGKKFEYNGKEYSYALQPYKKLYSGSIETVAYIVAGVQKEHYEEVMHYDYNLNGHLDQQDLENMILHCLSDPYYVFDNLNEDAVHMYTNKITKLQHKNAVIFKTKETKPVDYSFTINTAILGYDDGYCTEEPIQILPLSCLDEISGKYKKHEFSSDETLEYVIWQPITKKWSAGSYSKDSLWTYRSGIYVMLLNDDGSLRKEWVE